MKMLKVFFILSTSATLFSCGSDKLPKPQRLENLRVLDLISDLPEVDPGATVTITPYLSDSKGSGRALTIEKKACVDFGVNVGAEPTCENNPTLTTLPTTTETPGNSGNLYTGALTSFTVTIPSSAIMFTDPLSGAERSVSQKYNGISYLVFLKITASNGEGMTTFKRILVSTRPLKNLNPTLTSISNSILFESTSKNEAIMNLDASTTQEETYLSYNSTNSLTSTTEQLSTYWFSTSGTIKTSALNIGVKNKFTPAEGTPTTTFVVVLKDGHGGSAITIKTE